MRGRFDLVRPSLVNDPGPPPSTSLHPVPLSPLDTGVRLPPSVRYRWIVPPSTRLFTEVEQEEEEERLEDGHGGDQLGSTLGHLVSRSPGFLGIYTRRTPIFFPIFIHLSPRPSPIYLL